MAEARAVRSSSDLPSGYHSATRSPPGWNVSRLGSPPAYAIVYASTLPSYSAVNATVLPSGERLGNTTRPSCVVRRCARPRQRPQVAGVHEHDVIALDVGHSHEPALRECGGGPGRQGLNREEEQGGDGGVKSARGHGRLLKGADVGGGFEDRPNL